MKKFTGRSLATMTGAITLSALVTGGMGAQAFGSSTTELSRDVCGSQPCPDSSATASSSFTLRPPSADDENWPGDECPGNGRPTAKPKPTSFPRPTTTTTGTPRPPGGGGGCPEPGDEWPGDQGPGDGCPAPGDEWPGDDCPDPGDSIPNPGDDCPGNGRPTAKPTPPKPPRPTITTTGTSRPTSTTTGTSRPTSTTTGTPRPPIGDEPGDECPSKPADPCPGNGGSGGQG